MPATAQNEEARRECIKSLEELAESLSNFTSSRKNPEALVKSELVDCARGAIQKISTSLLKFSHSVAETFDDWNSQLRDASAATAVLSNKYDDIEDLVLSYELVPASFGALEAMEQKSTLKKSAPDGIKAPVNPKSTATGKTLGEALGALQMPRLSLNQYSECGISLPRNLIQREFDSPSRVRTPTDGSAAGSGSGAFGGLDSPSSANGTPRTQSWLLSVHTSDFQQPSPSQNTRMQSSTLLRTLKGSPLSANEDDEDEYLEENENENENNESTDGDRKDDGDKLASGFPEESRSDESEDDLPPPPPPLLTDFKSDDENDKNSEEIGDKNDDESNFKLSFSELPQPADEENAELNEDNDFALDLPPPPPPSSDPDLDPNEKKLGAAHSETFFDANSSDGTSKKRIIKALVTFDYAAQEPDEISLNVGEMIIVLNVDAGSGWSHGQSVDGSKNGLFPRGFVDLIE